MPDEWLQTIALLALAHPPHSISMVHAPARAVALQAMAPATFKARKAVKKIAFMAMPHACETVNRIIARSGVASGGPGETQIVLLGA
jgi:hypothetical protein